MEGKPRDVRPQSPMRSDGDSTMMPTDFIVEPATVEAYVAFYAQHGAISSDEGEMMMNALSRLVGMTAVEELRAFIRRDHWDIWDAGDQVEDKLGHAARRARARARAR